MNLNFEVEKLGGKKRKLESNLMAQEKSLAKVEEKKGWVDDSTTTTAKKVPGFTKRNSRY